MNTTLNRSIIILFIIFSNYNSCFSEIEMDNGMSIRSEFILGFSYNATKLTQSTDANLSFNPNVRIIWDTDTRLNIGIEAALLPVSRTYLENVNTEFGQTDFLVSINTMPLMLIFNMNFEKLDFYGGAGISSTLSFMEAFSEKSGSNTLNGSYMFAASYSNEISDGIDLGIESGIYYITDIDVFIQKISIKMITDIISW